MDTSRAAAISYAAWPLLDPIAAKLLISAALIPLVENQFSAGLAV